MPTEEDGRARLVVLISGSGSNLQAILDACADGRLNAVVAAVVSNKAEAYGLQRAAAAGLPRVVLTRSKGRDRREYDAELADAVAEYAPDWVVLAGWMHILSMAFLSRFPNRVVNLHPALPGQFAGTHAIERAFAAFQAGEISETGVMVHLVPDEGVDDGPVLGTARVAISAEDTLETLAAKVHAAEHPLLVDVLAGLGSGRAS